jgi:hypothetical protein
MHAYRAAAIAKMIPIARGHQSSSCYHSVGSLAAAVDNRHRVDDYFALEQNNACHLALFVLLRNGIVPVALPGDHYNKPSRRHDNLPSTAPSDYRG